MLVRKSWMGLIVAAALVGGACTDAEQRRAEQETESAAARAGDAVENAGDEIAEGARDVRDYTFAQSAEFRSDVRSRLAELDRDIEELGDEAGAEFREKRRELDASVEKLGDATEENWEESKNDVSRSIDELEADVEARRARSTTGS